MLTEQNWSCTAGLFYFKSVPVGILAVSQIEKNHSLGIAGFLGLRAKKRGGFCDLPLKNQDLQSIRIYRILRLWLNKPR